MTKEDNVFIAPGAVVMGDVRLGENVSIWYNAVIRADDDVIEIGKNSNIQDNCTLHLDPGNRIVIGEGVTVGHNAIVHGCSIGDNTLIGMGSIIMNYARIGSNCIIGAGAVVTEHTVIPDNSLVIGCPGRVKRTLSQEETKKMAVSAQHYVEMGQKYKKMLEQ